jgi:hypothetical protein
MQSKSEKIAFIIKHAAGDTPPGDVAEYYHKQTEAAVEEAFQKLLIGEKQRIVSADAETQTAIKRAAAQEAETARELGNLRWMQICQTVINGKVVQNNIANRTQVESWPLPHQGETFGVDMFRKALQDNPSLKSRLSWESPVDYSPTAAKARQAQVETSIRNTFHTLARDYDLSRCEANVQTLIQRYPEGADAYTIGTALQNHELNLAPCSKQEHLEYTKEMEAEHARKWKAMPVHELRKRSAECNAEREILLARHSWKERGVLTKEDEAAAEQDRIKKQEEVLGFPVMPEYLGETKLDAAYLKGCSRNNLMDAIRRWGSYQVNQRLVGK